MDLRTKKKKPEFLQPDNTKEKKNEEKPRNLWVSKKVLNICTLRAQEEKQKESEGATDAQASSSSGRAGTRLVSAHCGARVSPGREGVCADLEFHTTSSVGTVTNCLEL